jgi:ribonuclease D
MGLLGHDLQLSYAAMTAALFDIELDKSLARADWARRPVDPALLRYAADDVQFLAEAYPKLEQALSERQRLPWLAQECDLLTQSELYQPDPGSSWRRVRGAGSLDRSALAVLAKLAAWREEQAMTRNRPRQWVLKDHSLIALARTRPERKDQLAQVRGLNESFLRRNADKLLRICQSAPSTDAPEAADNRRPDVAEQSAFDELRKIVKTRADELGINASLLAPRAEIKRLLRGDAGCALLNGWRFDAVGRDLLIHTTGQQSSG